jgi:hypothetical protein
MRIVRQAFVCGAVVALVWLLLDWLGVTGNVHNMVLLLVFLLSAPQLPVWRRRR